MVSFGVYGAQASRKITVTTTAQGLGSQYAGSGYNQRIESAQILVIDQPIRYTITAGETPTATTGLYAPAGSIITLYDHTQFKNCKVIRDTAATGNGEIEVAPFTG